MKPELGCCYYPEHWPEERWEVDARLMRENGLSWVRVGEFAWSRLEPTPGNYNWEWLDRAIDTLAAEGLKIVLGTPTATPPRWMLKRHPDMLALDAQGQPRKFGSRRHYCFSHEGYRASCAEIVNLLAQRYGSHPAIAAWQIDNEYGCHDTIRSYSEAARNAFQTWLKARYQDIDTLNQAWGTVFWSMEYSSFDEVDLPNLTVTEPMPAHQLDFKRFSSDQVLSFNRLQCDILRQHSTAPLIHNYMGRIVEFDHFAVGADLDIASWDAYPLGFLEDRSDYGDEWRARFARQGDPDFQAFHHDLYRAVGRGRWWVMEQQPGPVNWAPYNPAPLPGMVRLWSWEAIAHGAEVVSYFRWRQLPFAQEQHHAGLLFPDAQPAPALIEANQTAQEIESIGEIKQLQSSVAIVFDYESAWAWETQPQGQSFDYFKLVFDQYRALRALGVSIDIITVEMLGKTDHKAIFIPGLMSLNSEVVSQLTQSKAQLMIGPRTGSRTTNFHIDTCQPHLFPDAQALQVESLRPGAGYSASTGRVEHWFEHYRVPDKQVALRTVEGYPLLISEATRHYLCGWPDEALARALYTQILSAAGVDILELPEGVRIRDTQGHRFWFNYNAEPCNVGEVTLSAAGVEIRPSNRSTDGI